MNSERITRMGWSKNTYVRRCKKCNQVIGMDSNWNVHNHDNLTCQWLGRKASIKLGNQVFTGEIIAVEKVYIANGIFDICTLEIFDHGKQIKIECNRQALTRVKG